MKVRQAVRSRLTTKVTLLHEEEMSHQLFEQGEVKRLINLKRKGVIESL